MSSLAFCFKNLLSPSVNTVTCTTPHRRNSAARKVRKSKSIFCPRHISRTTQELEENSSILSVSRNPQGSSRCLPTKLSGRSSTSNSAPSNSSKSLCTRSLLCYLFKKLTSPERRRRRHSAAMNTTLPDSATGNHAPWPIAAMLRFARTPDPAPSTCT
jgi:hypothetical protein